MRVEWQKFGWVEAQVFKPETPARSVILFCPGFPGSGATVFEQRHAGALTEEGYDVIVIHHKGTKIAGGFGPHMVNNSARLQRGLKAGETHLGGGLADIAEWMVEPLHVLKDIAEKYDSIHVIGNSFGAISALWSLTEDGAPIEKVKSLLLYAGAQGLYTNNDGIGRKWSDEARVFPHVAPKIEFDMGKPFASVFRDVYEKIPGRVKERLPERIRLTYLVVEKDEILQLVDTEQFNDVIGGRGKIVMDTVDHAWPEAFLMAHDTPNYRTNDLLELIRG